MGANNKAVLHLINGEFYSGVERVHDLAALGLSALGYEVWLGSVKHGIYEDRTPLDRDRLLRFDMKNRFDWLVTLRIARFIRQRGVAIVHSHGPRTAILGYLATRLSGIPLVHHVHSPASRDSERGIIDTINARVENFIMRRAEAVIVVSNSLKQYLLNAGVSESRISVVLNGIPAAVADTEHKPQPGAGQADVITIGMVALFRQRKGLEVLLQALAQLKVAGVALRFRAVGEFKDAAYKRSIMELVDELDLTDCVDWVGFVHDVDGQFRHFDVFVLPSIYGEGLPMVVLEAMRNGVPVVASRVEGIPDAIPSQEYGQLVDPGDAAQISQAIQRYIADPDYRERVCEQASQRQAQVLSADSMVSGMASIYAAVVD